MYRIKNVVMGACAVLCSLTANALSVGMLRTQYLENPVGIDVAAPAFCWQIESDVRSTLQQSYRIEMATDKGMSAIVYDSGIVESAESAGVTLEGLNLQPSTRYYWRVTVTDNHGSTAVSDGKAFFETGLMDSGWGGAEWIKAASPKGGASLRYTIEADMTLIRDAASVVFAYGGTNRYFMWAINTNDRDYPLVRRHVYSGGPDPQFSDTRIDAFTKEQLLGHERRLRIEVEGNEVETFIDDVKVDTYTDNSGRLTGGLIGFRVYKDAVDEQAYWDNVKVTTYNADGIGEIAVDEDFEDDTHDFSAGRVVEVDGNRKLYSVSSHGESKVLQDAATAAPRFRKDFALEGKVKRARLYTSALGVYNVYINGSRVGSLQDDGTMVYDELMPGWTDYRSTVFYMTHDVTGLLKEGNNAIGALVASGWWCGDVSHGIYGSTNTAFIAKLVVELENGEVVTVVTDPTWRSSAAGAVKSGEIYHGEVYDARRADGWAMPGCGVAGWSAVEPDNQKKGVLMAHEGPTVRVRPEMERKPVSMTVYDRIKDNGTTYGEINVVRTSGNGSLSLKKGETAVVDFGQNASGWAKFKVKGARGTRVDLRYAEMVNDSGESARGNDGPKGALYTVALRSAKACGSYTLNGDESGETYAPTTTFYGFRYCDITATDDVEISWITAETVCTATEEMSTIKVDDADVNRLYSNIVWGQRSNFLSVPTDCPQRDERLGWTADTQIFSLAASYNAQVQGFYHKWMRDMRDGQLENGAYPNVAPFNWVEHGSCAWADAGIILPWNVYVMYGDKKIIEENYESMVRYMDWLATQKEGTYEYLGSDTRYGDWLAFEDTDKRYISVAHYGYMADIMSRMSGALSETEGDSYDVKASEYADLFGKIKGEFKRRYVGGREGALRLKSQCAHLLALKFNMLPDEKSVEASKKALRDRIVANGNKLATGFIGTGVINQTLSEYGMDDLAYTLLLQHDCPSWLYSVDQGATTIWERWNSYTREDGFSKNIEMNSFNHYAYGAVGEWMYRYMAGIAPDMQNPGFKHIVLRPAFDADRRISNVDATFGSNYGPVKAMWKTGDGGAYAYNVTIPANTTATLTLPSAPEGMALYESGVAAGEATGVTDYNDNGVETTMTLGSGSYSFNVGNPQGGLDEVAGASGLVVHPNPCTDVVCVKVDAAIKGLELRSMSGVIVKEVADSPSMSVGGCAPGLYLLSVTDAAGKVEVVKLMKR